MRNTCEALEASGRPGEEDTRKDLHHHLCQTIQDAEILGLEVSKQKLMSQLINNTGEKNFSAVVVVGSPGSGKTALVNSVTSAKQVNRHFSCEVSARVSRHFDVRRILLLLFSQTRQGRDNEICLTGDLATDLRNALKGKRYLVVLDDVWSESHWRAIQPALPEESNGSRVVITTTKWDLASSIATSSSHIHLIEGVKEEESWQLFCGKAFSEEEGVCPPYLEDLSKEILHKCEGLPLAISAVGNLLARKPRLRAEWAKVKDNLRAEMESSPQFSDLNSSIQQSYDDLNGDLKSCLLYFSLFPAGSCIERERLIRLWVAVGFAIQAGQKPAEEVAEEYLNELIRRNLVVANMDFDERVRNCKVRYFLHYFLAFMSKQEDFAAILDNPNTKPGENVRHLSIANPTTTYPENVSCLPIADLSSTWQSEHVRTCIMLGRVSPDIIKLSNQFQKLKVLDFQGAPLEKFPECVVDLGLLRYLSLRGSRYIFEIPGSIHKLRYLKFLDLKHTSVTWLPMQINLLHNLRHLLVYHYHHQGCYGAFDTTQGVKIPGEIGSLNSLQKLTLLKAEDNIIFFFQLGKMMQLQKLGLIDLRSIHGRFLCKSLANMKRLSVLDLRSVNKSEFLDLDYQDFPCNLLQRVYLKGRLEKLPRWIKSLRSLVRIHLRWSRLRTSPIDELQELKNLIELHLVDAFIGEKLKFRKGGFQKLKVLLFEELPELKEMKVSSEGSMCKLEKLTLCNCGKLTMLPPGIQRHTELKELVLLDMPPELTNSLREWSTDQSKIKVYISDAAKQTWLQQDLSLIARHQTIIGMDWNLMSHIPKTQMLQHQVNQKRDTSSLKEQTGSQSQEKRPCKQEAEQQVENTLAGTSRLPVGLKSQDLPKRKVTRLHRLRQVRVLPRSTLGWWMAFVWLRSKLILLLLLFLLWNRYIYTDELPWHAVLTHFFLCLNILLLVLGSREMDATRRVNEMCWHGIQNLKAKAQGCRLFINLELIGRFGKQETESYAKGMLLLLGEEREFEKNDLIQLWMAAGCIELEPMEIYGAHYFKKFISREYILHSHCKSLYKVNPEKVKSDLDEIRGKSSYLRLESISQSTVAAPAEILHVAVAGKHISDKMFETLRKFNRLRTLLFVSASGSRLEQMPRDLFLCFECLLVLDLSKTDTKELPSSASKMIHLRYLDLSWTLVEVLPETISRFSKLQTLKLRGCSRLWKLPTEMNRLVKLRHLDFDVLGQLGAMPKMMRSLVSLRTLPAFIVSIHEGCKITELKYLNNLTGELCIARLEHVQSAHEAKMASLSTKKGLTKLDLRWSDFPLQDRSAQDLDDIVLENLCPHSDLEELQIRCYGGTNLPSWIKGGSLHKLTSIMLFKCEHVSVLPALQNLPSLEHLGLVRLNSVTKMDVRRKKNHVAFPRLQRLIIDEMLDLNTWKEGQESDFPCLVELTIKHCPKLLELPSLVYLSSLKRLEISSCPEVQFVDDKQLSTQLEFLIVEDCPLIKENCLEEDGKSRDKIKHVKNVWIDQEGIWKQRTMTMMITVSCLTKIIVI